MNEEIEQLAKSVTESLTGIEETAKCLRKQAYDALIGSDENLSVMRSSAFIAWTRFSTELDRIQQATASASYRLEETVKELKR